MPVLCFGSFVRFQGTDALFPAKRERAAAPNVATFAALLVEPVIEPEHRSGCQLQDSPESVLGGMLEVKFVPNPNTAFRSVVTSSAGFVASSGPCPNTGTSYQNIKTCKVPRNAMLKKPMDLLKERTKCPTPHRPRLSLLTSLSCDWTGIPTTEQARLHSSNTKS